MNCFREQGLQIIEWHQVTSTSGIYFVCHKHPLWPVFNLSLVNITDFIVSKLGYFILTGSKLLSAVLLLVDEASCPAGPHVVTCYSSVTSGLAAVSALTYILSYGD